MCIPVCSYHTNSNGVVRSQFSGAHYFNDRNNLPQVNVTFKMKLKKERLLTVHIFETY